MAFPEKQICKQRGHGQRVRFAPQQLTYGAASPAHKLSPAEEVLQNELRGMRDQVELNKQMLKQSAYQNACPLLCGDANMDWPPPTHNMDELVGVQPKKKGLASDDVQYDLERIKRYIRDNMDRQLLSPVTGEPMTPCVLFTVNGHSKKDPSAKRSKVMKWSPGVGGAEDKCVYV